jgi:short-subunit dehydrogenase
MKKMAVITGCDSGIGKDLSEIFIKNGYSLIISFLEKNPFPDQPEVFGYKLDLRIQNEIESFAASVKKHCAQGYHLEYLINNAGVAKGGSIEDLPMEIFREVFEINFFGVVSLTQKLIPELIKTKGTIVIVGSLAGRIALPFLSPYVSTKFALEGFSDSLRRELIPFGIKTILIEPGAIATPIWNNAKKQDISFVSEKYRKSLKNFEDNFIDAGNAGMSSAKAAEQIFKILKKKNPGPRYLIAEKTINNYVPLIIPRKLFDKIVIKLFSMDYGKK